MDPRLYMLAGTFALLVIALIATVVSALRASRRRRAWRNPPPTTQYEWPALPPAPSQEIDTSLEGLEFSGSEASPTAELLAPLRIGEWQPSEQPASVDALADLSLKARLETYRAGIDDLAEPMPAPAPAPAPMPAPAPAPAPMPAPAPAPMPAPAPAPAPVEDTVPEVVPPDPTIRSQRIVAQAEPFETPNLNLSVPEVHPPAGAHTIVTPPLPERVVNPVVVPAVAPAPVFVAAPASAAPAEQSAAFPSWADQLPEVAPLSVATTDATVSSPAVEAEFVTDVFGDAELWTAPVTPEPAGVSEVDLGMSSAVKLAPFADPAPEPEPVALPEDAFWESMFREQADLASVVAVAASDPAPAPVSSPAPTFVPESTPAAAFSPPRPNVSAPIPGPAPSTPPESAPSSLPTVAAPILRPPVVVSAPAQTLAASAVASAHMQRPPRPRTVVRSLFADDGFGAGPSVLEPLAAPLPSDRVGLSGAPLQEIVMAAPVEMWFGESRVGVKAGTKTYAQFRKYADVLFSDLQTAKASKP